MEIYLFFAFLLLYIVTSFILSENMLLKIWTLSFIFAFVVTSVALGFVRLSRQDVMMDANQLNWYYILFLFGMVAVVLGVFNVWMTTSKGRWFSSAGMVSTVSMVYAG